MPFDPEILAAGFACHRAGDFDQAHALYRQLLVSDPGNAQILNLLGAVCLDGGSLAAAGEYLLEAQRVNPGLAAAHDNLGLWHARQQRLAEAVASFRRAIELDPRNAQTRSNLAGALFEGGQLAAAIDTWQEAIELAPDHVQAHFGLAEALARAGRRLESIDVYRSALGLWPDVPEACVNLAMLSIDEQMYDEAAAWARRAIELRHDFAEAHHRLGCALARQGKQSEAIAALRAAVALPGATGEASNNLSVALFQAGDYAAAVEACRHAVTLDPANAEFCFNLGNAYHALGDARWALEQYDRAVVLRPDFVEARHNRGALWLLEGRLAEGFAEYDFRIHSRDYRRGNWPGTLWQGEPLSGRTLVICPEQGIGDTLHFIRYAPMLKERGGRVIVACSPAQQPILSRTPGIDAFYDPAGPPPPADYHVPVMSLPARLQTTLATIPATVPYVFADERRAAAWRQRLAEWDGFKVGIVWQGNPRRPGDRQRSIPLSHYGVLARVPGVRLVNLQKGPGIEQLAAVVCDWPVIDFGDEIDEEGAFLDTAAIMKSLDLVITSDTAPAHLAGALGVPTWVALQKVPDWRFLLGRDDSPWYPTMRLFRQATAGDWPDVFRRIADALARRVGAE